ncbi:methyltransferase [Nannocystaceae bacterium ST9]
MAVEAKIDAIVTQTKVLNDRFPEYGKLMAAMLLAVRQGIGSDLRAWLTRSGKAKPEVAARLFGAARGQIAIEAGEWPPKPERGDRYGEAEFRGVLESLASEPVVRDAQALADRWPVELEKVAGPGARQRFYFDADLSWAIRRAVNSTIELAATSTFHAKPKTPATIDVVWAARDKMLERVAHDQQNLETSLDPAVYDPRSDPRTIYERLCKISTLTARRLLEEVFKVEFPNHRDAGELCYGHMTFDQLKAKGAAHRLQQARNAVEAAVARQVAAQALLEVFAKLGDAPTVKRFNLAYWRLHPEIRESQRDAHRLRRQSRVAGSIYYQDVMAPKGQSTELVVRGPNEQGFSIRTNSGDESQALEQLREQLHEFLRGDELQKAQQDLAALTGAAEPAPAAAIKPSPAAVVAAGEPSPAAESRIGRPADRKRQADKLRAIAAKLAADAETTIGQERQENTRRRASIAAGIRKRAYSDQVIARALTLAADEVERGQLTYIARLTSRPQIDDLEEALRRARDERRRKSEARVDMDGEPEPADIEFARYRALVVNKSQLRDLMKLADGKIDAKTRKRLRPLAEGEDQVLELVGNDVELVRTVATKIREASGDTVSYSVGIILGELRAIDRLARLGIRDTASLQTALREYLGCCRGQVKRATDDPIAARKRELQFASIPGFVPTPRPLAERLVEAAEIGPGMRVLEPSAGSGAIAEVIRERHPDAKLDVIELQYSLRTILQDQGFTPIGNDFMRFVGGGVEYDRIVMNPPFEKRQDTIHIDHALDLLAPGGRLVAVASASLATRGDEDTEKLRSRIAQLGGRILKLPEGSFAASGTDVHTVLVVVDLPAAEQRKPKRPALTVVPTPVLAPVIEASANEPPAAADCGCKHPPEPVVKPTPAIQAVTDPRSVPTPRPLAERLVELAQIQPGMRVLEPSAGTGVIAEVIRARHPDAKLDVVEFNRKLNEQLRERGFQVVGFDFMGYDEWARYDRIVMSPPFDAEVEVRHIAKARMLLNPGGRLVAVASSSLTSEASALRNAIARSGTIELLPAGTFEGIAAVLVVYDEPGLEPAKPVPASQTVVTVDGGVDSLNQIKAQWRAFEDAQPSRSKRWATIPNTACLEQKDGDDGVTLCVSGQAKPRPIGACPPLPDSPTGSRKVALCEPGEALEWFGGSEWIPTANAEAANRFARKRAKKTPKPAQGPLPALDDFDGQAGLLAALVPTGIVTRRDEPAWPIEVDVMAPHRQTSGGSLIELGLASKVRPLGEGETLVATVHADGPVALAEFVAGLGDEWTVYTGPIAYATALHLARALANEQVDKSGVTLDHFRSGRFGNETLYWVESPEGEPLVDPIRADGKRPSLDAAREFASAKLPELELLVPDGWSLNDTIVMATRIKRRRVWLAWQPGAGLYRNKAGGKPWAEAKVLTDKDGRVVDLDLAAANNIRRALDEGPRGATVLVGGAWLGHLYPIDFGKDVIFESPTGGQLDLDALRADYAETLRGSQESPGSDSSERWVAVAKRRVAWASKWLAAQGKPAKTPKPKSPKSAPAVVEPPQVHESIPKPEAPEARTTPVRLAVVPAGDVEHDREQEQPMKTTSTKTQAGAKKATAKKVEPPRTTKKAAAKKAASAEQPRTTKKTAAKKASAEPPRTTKKTSKKPAAKPVSKPVEKVAAPTKPAKVAGPACVSDDTCPPELESWRNRLRQGDRVRFRKNSRIAAVLGIDTDRVFEIRCTTCRNGQRLAILDLGLGSASDVAIPVGQFAVVERGQPIPEDIRACVAKLAKMGGPISEATRTIVAEFGRVH